MVVCHSQATRWPKASWACAVLLRFSNHNVLDKSQLPDMRTISEWAYSGEGNWRPMMQMLMFGSRNCRTKSRKQRNYAPHFANSWLHHWNYRIYILHRGLHRPVGKGGYWGYNPLSVPAGKKCGKKVQFDPHHLTHVKRRNITRGQSNLTKSASRGPISRLGVTPGVESCTIEFLG